MNTKLLLISVSIITLSSCSTLYKSGQTPDDVYFSPVRTTYDEAKREEDKSREEANRTTTTEDRQIRMGINNRRWRSLDYDYYSYNYSPYNYGYNSGYYYNPFYCTTPVYNPVVVVVNNPRNTTPRKVNLGGYGNGYNNTNTTAIKPKSAYGYSSRPAKTYNNNNSGLGSVLRKVFSTGSNSNTNSNNSTNSSSNNNTNRTYTPSSSSSSTSSGTSSSSGGGTVSRPARNGKG